ncbi:cycloheximide resistance protein [Grosmannia clavigera kw1407]|uniref:Cycloheximide resistance protein n=1 Tax=Grosmannia clavigera (strain kw1407 / UAMH 11150) TaxID=655863 RepID=F0XB45_GROCL|nr:cycloheximide resistance protein [Grosmannia clavigera kw1407]EFX04904.1 cycloheximide resistance protein [Grosmannia clavigera kw1407]
MPDDKISTQAIETAHDNVSNKAKHHPNLHTLGRIRLRHEHTNEIILTPAPSADPNDPLRWSTAYKIYISVLVSLAMVMCNFMAAGPTVAMLAIASDYKHGGSTVSSWVSSASYFFNNSSLLQGVSCLFWVPLLNKYGRRPVYIASLILYLSMTIGSGFAKTYAGELTTRTILGIGAGAGECLGPVTITDVFYLHQRGYGMAIYNAALSAGVAFGIIISGLITTRAPPHPGRGTSIANPWRTIYWVGAALVGFLLLVVFFFFPETAFVRTADGVDDDDGDSRSSHHYRKLSYGQQLRPWTGKTYTEESFWRMFIRPFGLILLPPVFWATIVMSVTIGFLVAVVSNFASAFSATYDFETWQSGLCFVSAIVGCVFGTFAGGPFSDWVADYFTRRNGGIREPEMRLPAIIPSVIAAPMALALYGVGIGNSLHWMVPTFALGLLSFAISQGTNVSFVYCIDSYRPVAAEVTVAQLAFKSCFGFLLSFYTNPWVDKSGYKQAYGAMAGISGGCLLFFIPLFFWGKQIRLASMQWRIVRFVFWKTDREVGE